MNILELSEQEIGRRQSLQELRQLGIDPYPAAEFPVTAWSTDIINDFEDLPVIGKGTIKTMIKSGATTLAVEAGKTVVLDVEEVVALADKNNIFTEI